MTAGREFSRQASLEVARARRSRTSPVDAWSHSPGAYERWAKPILDRLLGLGFSLLALPPMLVVACVIRITMGRPLVLRQARVGKNGKVFLLFKFRTMKPDRRYEQRDFNGPDRRQVHKSPNDPRLTPVGRFLRRWSLDELPQFWNVLLGQMSLVGPRPEMVEIVERHYAPWQHRRHAVKPGLTGLWQVSARGDGLMHHNTRVDLEYLERISFTTDMKILALTLPAALGVRRGF
jgi:lipopolysaccharide/colanic/teichoic acid biosynthesis glycosyltransferase